MTAPTSGYTASWLLSGSKAETSQGLTQILRGMAANGILGRLTDRAFATLSAQLAEITHGLINIDLGALLLEGLRRHTLLVTAARATLDKPDASEVVEIAGYTVSVTHRPSVDVLVNEVQVTTIALELVLDLQVEALVGTVKQGRLVDLQVGPCTAQGTLHCESVRLAAGSAHLDPQVVVRLGRGLPLIREA
jgi:hypothetical protein